MVRDDQMSGAPTAGEDQRDAAVSLVQSGAPVLSAQLCPNTLCQKLMLRKFHSERSQVRRFSVPIMQLATALTTALHGVTLAAQNALPIRELSAPDAVSTARFENILQVRALPSGKIIVNDGGRRQIIMLDAALRGSQVLIDSSGTGVQTYGSHPTLLVSYVGDSTLFVDAGALALVVIDPGGSIVRSMAPPVPKATQFLWRFPSGFDANGRFIFRSQYAEQYVPTKNTPAGILPVFPDSAPILRADLDTRRVDTIAKFQIRKSTILKPAIDKDGKPSLEQYQQLISTVDDWGVLSNGSIAIVRGQDYHVDVIGVDGKTTSGPKLPFDFKRFADDEKQKMVDSATSVEEKRLAATRPAQGGAQRMSFAPVKYVPISDMPDYYPPIRVGSALPDRDGNLWILPTTSAQSRNGELIYDVVNSQGIPLHRVRMPVGRSAVGFAPNGVVFMISKGENGWLLERAKVAASSN